ncbi:N-acetylgalactosaminyltransferase 7-like [Lingula anatina]|uniref:Polypeptide N-acetylgalactosaminyltransferase n=1 Tax=Lingula anatina TaxID=7574 RepID=A0A2R2MNJ0_LINAN|nr:N-acetylgalactosaminyltransferase 7-like [Lingula anatina]|eukprot:XP_023931769.1 N-acetylgalactosaminyltransferase 7-like [Lingula anatina]
MRLTPKFLLKIGAVVITLVFVGPILLSHLDSKESHAVRKKDLGKSKHGNSVLHPPEGQARKKIEFEGQQPGRREADEIEEVVDHPGNVQHMNQRDEKEEALHNEEKEQEKPKEYGPQATLRPGTMGNFEPETRPKTGPGEMGEPVYVSMSEKAAADRAIREFGFNMIASDKIAMDRNIPDTRPDECKYWQYPEKLPTASVILVFHNEGFSTLVRTVHSVINTSPPHLLREVVMVDDFSDKEHLQGKLEDYLLKNFRDQVKLYRNSKREGLIRTRTLGAKYAKGDVIVFLDAHCECNKNWLVPLLARIAYDRTIMAVPIVDGIDWNNFRYHSVYGSSGDHRGIFEWGFLYKESKVPDKELARREHSSEPYRSPTHAGGLFAMDRKYFFELGGYDPGMMIWGGENFELSFKIWQCGGSIEWVPCSHVGHVYRNHMPYGFGNIDVKIPVVLLNYMRVVEVWLDDEFKEYFYTREPTIRGYPIGNISEQLEFKKKHNCKSFKWFMDNIAYEIYDRFPPPPPNKKWGEVKKNGRLCWDTMGGQVGNTVGLSMCHHFGGNQLFRLNTKGQLAVGERCIDLSGGQPKVIFCSVMPTGPWDFDESTHQVRHKTRGQCVQADGQNMKLVMAACDASLGNQKWEINEIQTWKR